MAVEILRLVGVVVLILMAAALVLPVHLALVWQTDPTQPSTARVRLFGGGCPAITVYDSSKPPKAKAAVRHRKKRDTARGRKWRPNRTLYAESTALVRRVTKVVHFDAVAVDAEVGLGDPAATGQLYGQICPFLFTLGGHVSVRPNFDRARLQGCASAQLHFTPLAVIWPFACFGWRVFGPFR